MSKTKPIFSESSSFLGRPPATTFEFLAYQAEINPERTALIVNKESFSFRRFCDDAIRFSRALADMGVSRGQIVLVSHLHFYVHWLLLIACENVGAISASYHENIAIESSKVLETARFIIATLDPPGGVPNVVFQRIDHKWLNAVFQRNLNDIHDYPRLVLGLDEAQRLTHSTGTTGGQKAMLLNRGAQEAKMKALWQSSGYSRETRFLVTMPFAVNSAFLQANLCLRLGALVVVAPVASAIRDHQINYFEVLPIMLDRILRELPRDFIKPPRLDIKVIGAPLTKYLREKSLKSLCTGITGRYATNELWPIATDMNEDGVGTVFPGIDLMIVDDQGREQSLGQVGHVAVRSETMIKGYFKDPDATQRHFRDGWFLTGDVGRLLRPGKFKLLGRSDDVLNQGGLKCYAYPIEEKIRGINGIVDVAVVSVPSDHVIDDLCVAVVLGKEVDPQDVFKQIMAAATGWPRIKIKIVTELVKNRDGKLIRDVVRKLFTFPPVSLAAAGR